ncbi:unnamed protein product [Clavelina lepadiformis]|uniref:N-acetyltransferase domain-containing protein n=1 Tax=Clavelina lepadiformis TaxID=159417 RepID=A0ABP0G0A3_CLALP
MTVDYVIRKAKEEDFVYIYEMIRVMAAYERMEDQVKMTLEKLIKDGFGDHPLYHALVAESSDGTIIGYSIFNYAYSPRLGRQVYIEDIMVLKEFRREGIGKEFIKMANQIALSEGCIECKLSCLKWNIPAMSLYKKLGFRNETETKNLLFFRFDLSEMKKITEI